MTTLFLAWQDPESRRWFTVGRLDVKPGLYSFTYTNGALNAKNNAGFEPLAAFPELGQDYTSNEIFPLFSNRFLPTYRAEYSDYLKWLNIPESEKDPVAILARSGGQRATDTLEVFPMPIRNECGAFEFHFLVHGLRHMAPEAVLRVSALGTGERLLAMRDVQNPKDPRAIALRTAETVENDMYIVGYLPRYLCDDYFQLAEEGSYPTITVERVNLPPAPVQFRLLCKAIVNSRTDIELCANPDYQRISFASSLRDETAAGLV
jgi:hypothetical protein